MSLELFLEDSYLKECHAKIIKIENNTVILDQTVFYPTGGGQEHDQGYLYQKGGKYKVIDVQRRGNEIVHFIDNAGELTEGPVIAQIDWNRRYSFMKKHTLLHVFAAVVYKKTGAIDTSSQIYPDRARIDFIGFDDIDQNIIDEILNETNRLLQEDHLVTSRYINRNEADQLTEVAKKAVEELPSSVTSARIISIESIEEYPCGGTHVKNTSEIGQMEIKKIKSKGSGRRRFEIINV